MAREKLTREDELQNSGGGVTRSNFGRKVLAYTTAIAVAVGAIYWKMHPSCVTDPNSTQPHETKTTYPSFESVQSKLRKHHDTQITRRPGGALTESPDKSKVVLTFDICSPYSGTHLQNLLDSLEFIAQKSEFPVVVFVAGTALRERKIRAALERLKSLPHISIQNHGLRHQPCTSKYIDPIYGQIPTGSLQAAYREIVRGARAIQMLTGKKPKYFRSATLYSDALVEEMVRELGMKMVSKSTYTDDKGGQSETGGPIRRGAIHLGHAINFDGVKNIYERLEAEGIQTVWLD